MTSSGTLPWPIPSSTGSCANLNPVDMDPNPAQVFTRIMDNRGFGTLHTHPTEEMIDSVSVNPLLAEVVGWRSEKHDHVLRELLTEPHLTDFFPNWI